MTVAKDQRGQAMAEYGVVLALVTAALAGLFDLVLPGAIQDALGGVVALL